MILVSRFNLIVDDILRFNRTSQSVETLSTYKFISFLRQRYGISYDIAKLLISHMGFNASLRLGEVPESSVSIKLRSFFLVYKNELDLVLKNFMLKQVRFLIQLKTIRGYKHLYGYPVHGQRRRSNAVTASKNLLKISKV